jgi:hypothetical protein
MVAELQPILSDAAPDSNPRAEFGNRFQLRSGTTGSLNAFSAVPFCALADFRNVVTILAEPTADGRFIAWSAAIIDADGHLEAGSEWPMYEPPGSIAFVHFLSEDDTDLEALLGDLAPVQSTPEFKLAA